MASEQIVLDSLSNYRRAQIALTTEMSEFATAAHTANIALMSKARRLAHEQLDIYLDTVATMHALSRENQK